ncbi:hypothetical protein T440DRAFT_525200 [Plenodomus tracheiphilus IPT5]|uniref:Uncharacterized protein n=1 Tax=Plenodomus tracheiphilus IPT5 TaxID=1408161 RepID=A0A6A7BF00_9PLEO|nr:hypothetical protein T440DRAFT_525200 [Plenodomus tracheiphilus IPT5]
MPDHVTDITWSTARIRNYPTTDTGTHTWTLFYMDPPEATITMVAYSTAELLIESDDVVAVQNHTTTLTNGVVLLLTRDPDVLLYRRLATVGSSSTEDAYLSSSDATTSSSEMQASPPFPSTSSDATTSVVTPGTNANGSALSHLPSNEISSSHTASPAAVFTNNSKLGSGTIAGVAEQCTMYLLLRRRKRAMTATDTPADNGPWNQHSNSQVANANQYPPEKVVYRHESSGVQVPQELESPKEEIGSLRFSGLATDVRHVELPSATDGLDYSATSRRTSVPANQDRISKVIDESSPHVQAQRRREVEWLESEEVKLRQRREELLQQGRKHSG